MPRLMMTLPAGARNVEVGDGYVALDMDESPDADVPPMPAPMPDGERFPDWRRRRLIAASTAGGLDGSDEEATRALGD